MGRACSFYFFGLCSVIPTKAMPVWTEGEEKGKGTPGSAAHQVQRWELRGPSASLPPQHASPVGPSSRSAVLTPLSPGLKQALGPHIPGLHVPSQTFPAPFLLTWKATLLTTPLYPPVLKSHPKTLFPLVPYSPHLHVPLQGP